MSSCEMCGRGGDEVRLVRGHAIPRFLDKSRSNRGTFKICMECEMIRAEKEYSIAQSLYMSESVEFYKSFLKSTFEIESLSGAKLVDNSLQNSMNRLLYANVIAAIEACLSDAFISTVMSDPLLIRKVIETDPEFKNRKFELSEIYSAYEGVESTVREYLANLIYHNLSKVSRLYGSVLEVSFPSDLAQIYRAINVRHDIVHRNGKSKNNVDTKIDESDIHDLLDNSRKFVEHVNKQLPSNSNQNA